MPISFRRFLVIETLAVAAFNAGANATYTSWMWSKIDPLNLPMIAADLSGTPAFIGMLSVLFGTAAIRRKIADGRVAPPERSLAFALPQGIVVRALLVSAICAALLAVPLSFSLSAMGALPLSLGDAVGIKVVITLIFSVAIVPIIIVAAANDVALARRRPAIAG